MAAVEFPRLWLGPGDVPLPLGYPDWDGRWPEAVVAWHMGTAPEEPRRYVPEPERTARLEYDEVHCDYVCTACGERTPTGVFEAVANDDRLLLKPMRYCPACGTRLVD